MRKTMYKDIMLRNGNIIKKGTIGEVKPIPNNTSACFVTIGDHTYQLRYSSVFKAPSINQIMKWDWDNGVCKTPAGKKVEPDGYDSEGFPSWQLIIGVI